MKNVSVVLPTIGRIEYLDKAIESLLNQSIPFSEIIIFDNSIKQNIRELSKYKNNENLHWKKSGKQLDPINSWNMAVKTTSCEYVTVFGDDDIAYNEFHSYIQKNLEKSDFVYINYDIMDENDNITQHNDKNEVTYTSEEYRHLRMSNKLGLMIPGAVFKRAFFDMVKGYEDSGLTSFLYSDDLLYFKIATLSGKITFSGKSLWKYRVHSGQIGNLKRLKDFSNSVPTYIEKLESSLLRLGVNEKLIYSQELGRVEYIKKLISDRFFIIIFKLYKAKEMKLTILNFYDLILDKKLSRLDKRIIFIDFLYKLGKKIVK